MATPKRLNRSESRANTRAELLQAARVRFSKFGYAGTASEQVAEDAGYSRGAMYYNFANKDELFTELMRTCFNEDIAALEILAQQHQADVVMAATEAFRAMSNSPDAYLLRLEFWMRALRDPIFQATYLNEHRRYRTAIETLGQGKISPEIIAVLVGLHNGLELFHLLEPKIISIEMYQDIVQRVVGGNHGSR